MNNKEIVKELKLLRGKIGLDNTVYAISAVGCLIEELEAEPVYTKEMHERGELPPVGAVVQAPIYEIEVAFTKNKRVYFLDGSEEVSWFGLNQIKPIQTQEEKNIERMSDLIGAYVRPHWTNKQSAEELLKHVTLKEVK